MDLHAVVTTLEGAVVIVDDHFAPPDFNNIDPDARTAQYNFLNDNPDRCKELAALLGVTGGDENNAELVTNTACQKAGEFWEQFKGGAHSDLLGLLLNDLKDENQRNRQYIDELVKIIKAEFGVDPQTFVTLEEARESLKTCAIAFLDYLIDETIVEPGAAIAHHKTVSKELGSCFYYDSKDWPKLVFLISSKLPDPNGLELFRDQMGIKAAFFSPLDKKDIQEELRSAVTDLRKAANRVRGRKERKGHGGLVLLGIALAAVFNPITGPQIRKWISERVFGESDGFTYQGGGGNGSAQS